jgi:large subunit ribosomal protein L12
MKYTYAALLLAETGRERSERNLTAVVEAAGGTVEQSRAKAFVAALGEVDLDGLVDAADPADVETEVSATTDHAASGGSTAAPASESGPTTDDRTDEAGRDDEGTTDDVGWSELHSAFEPAADPIDDRSASTAEPASESEGGDGD